MKNNKKGSLFLAVGFAFMFIIFGFLLLNFIIDEVTTMRVENDCTNSSISDGNKVTCLLSDVSVPYYILIILGLVGGFIGKEL